MALDIKGIDNNLVEIQKELTTISKDGNIVGRKIAEIGRKLEMGAKKIAHFFKTGEWKSNQARNTDQLNKILNTLNTDIKLTRENIIKLIKHDPKSANAYKEEFQQFSENIAFQMRVVKDIIKELKRHPEKLERNTLDSLDTQVMGVLENCSAIGKQVARQTKHEAKETSKKQQLKSGPEGRAAREQEDVVGIPSGMYDENRHKISAERKGKKDAEEFSRQQQLKSGPEGRAARAKGSEHLGLSKEFDEDYVRRGEYRKEASKTNPQDIALRDQRKLKKEQAADDVSLDDLDGIEKKFAEEAKAKEKVTKSKADKSKAKKAKKQIAKEVQRQEKGNVESRKDVRSDTSNNRFAILDEDYLEPQDEVEEFSEEDVVTGSNEVVEQKIEEKEAVPTFLAAKGFTTVADYADNLQTIIAQFAGDKNVEAQYLSVQAQIHVLKNTLLSNAELNQTSELIQRHVTDMFNMTGTDLTPAIAKKL